MRAWAAVAATALVVLSACSDSEDTEPTPPTTTTPAGQPVNEEPIVPAAGSVGSASVDCTGAYTLPAELTGSDGLGHHGWQLDDLTLGVAWSNPNAFVNRWLSTNDNSAPSLRVRPWLAPEASYCYTGALKQSTSGASSGQPILGAMLSELTAFSHRDTAYDELSRTTYTAPSYEDPLSLLRALRGLLELPNPLPGAPAAPPWDEATRDALLASLADYPAELDEALARLVLAIGEAALLKQQALAAADQSAMIRIFDQFLIDNYRTNRTPFVSPFQGTVKEDIYIHADSLDSTALHAAAIAVSAAADDCRAVLASISPFDSPELNLLTPHGRIVVQTSDADSTYAPEQLADVVLLVDLGGADVYHGRFAATHQFWMSAAVLLDARGNDQYTPETADIEATETTATEAFANDQGFTQGTGLFGVGVLIDGAGDDVYTATVYGQGAGAFGVGVLYDAGGTDTYKLGNAGQGSGYFGIGALIDAAGSDYYGIYTMGQGNGRPGGHGVLLDLAGDDKYLAYHNEDPPELPSPGYNNYFGLNGSTWSYSDSEGRPHYMSNSQGVGWGFRGDWFTDGPSVGTNWMGGFGALVDLGQGTDEHFADCMAMGQGFVYGFGLLYDEGGDDHYRTFWWGPAAAAHMGVGVLIDEDGNDDIHVNRLSGGYGFDCSVGWVLDHGGNDRYGGQFNYGRAYTVGMTFFINDGGDDEYNVGSAVTDPPFGIVDTGFAGQNLLGAFLDLGGGTDTYNTAVAGVGNDATWYLDPVGADVDPNIHKGIGIDR